MTAHRQLGQVLRDTDGVRLEFVRTYDAPIADVWSALTDPERMPRWFGRWRGDPSSGSVEVALSDEEGSPTEQVIIDACEPPRWLAVTMANPDRPWPLEATLREGGGGTSLRFVHRLAEPYDASSIGPGWHYYLDRLGAEVAGQPVPDSWDDYYPTLAEAYPVPAGPGGT